MNYHIYILFSDLHKRTYVGQTEKLEERLNKHNRGEVRSTKAYRPWRIIYQEVYPSRAEAMQREQWLKSPKGRQFISTLFR